MLVVEWIIELLMLSFIVWIGAHLPGIASFYPGYIMILISLILVVVATRYYRNKKYKESLLCSLAAIPVTVVSLGFLMTLLFALGFAAAI